MPPPIPISDERVVPPQKAAEPNLGEVGRSFCVFGVSKPREDADDCGEEDGVGSESDAFALAALECGVRVGSITPDAPVDTGEKESSGLPETDPKLAREDDKGPETEPGVDTANGAGGGSFRLARDSVPRPSRRIFFNAAIS
jgi:hypothetical protein